MYCLGGVYSGCMTSTVEPLGLRRLLTSSLLQMKALAGFIQGIYCHHFSTQIPGGLEIGAWRIGSGTYLLVVRWNVQALLYDLAFQTGGNKATGIPSDTGRTHVRSISVSGHLTNAY